MCLSTVVNQKKEQLAKNVAFVTTKDGKLVFTDIMGIPLAIKAEIVKIDLMENLIYVNQVAE